MDADLPVKRVGPREGTKRAKMSVHADFCLCLLCLFVADVLILDPCHPRSSAAYSLIPRMVLTLGMTFHLCAVKINLSEVARAVAFRLVIEMRRRRIAAFSAGGHGSGAYGCAKLDDGDEAVAARAVNLFRALVRTRGERRQRAPDRRSEADGNTWSSVVEWMDDVVGEALEAIDVSPW